MISQKEIDDVKVLESMLNYIRQDSFASQLHRELLEDMNRQIESNNQMVSSLGEYVARLGERMTSEDNLSKFILEGGSNLGDMLLARQDVQRANNKLIAEKVKLEENFRVLYKSNATDYYGAGILSKKTFVYPYLLVSAYLLLIFVIYTIRAALVLKEELKREEEK